MRCKTFQCRTNLFMALNGDDAVPVTLAVEFEVEPPDPDVGIMGCSIAGFTAKVIAVDGQTAPEELAAAQRELDANEGDYADEIDEACLESLDDGDDRGGD